MINATILVGRLTKSPELKHTQSGIAYVRFTLAVNRSFTDQNGERKADFINCIAWRLTAENLAKYQTKGSLIGLEGRIETSSFEGQDGKRVFTTDVVAENIQFLEAKANNSSGQGQGASQQESTNGGYQQQSQQQPQYQQQPTQYQQQPTYGGQQNQGQGQQFAQNAGVNNYNSRNGGGNQFEVSDDDLPF